MTRVCANDEKEMILILKMLNVKLDISELYNYGKSFIFIDESNNFDGWCYDDCLVCKSDTCECCNCNFKNIDAKVYLREKKLERICT